MTSIGGHETSYNSGQKPLKPDTNRGKWAASGDFFFACISNVFNSTHFSTVAYLMFVNHRSASLTFIYYILCTVLYVMPLMFIQSFLGQFSSSGYISVFRIAPLFKGLGYVIFLLNFVVLTYVVVYAAIPLFYAFTSTFALSEIITCNNTWNSNRCVPYDEEEIADEITPLLSDFIPRYNVLAAHEYIDHHLKIQTLIGDSSEDSFKIYWPVFLCALAVWGLIALVMSREVHLIGKINRFISISLMITLLVFVVKALTIDNLFNMIATIFDFTHVRASDVGLSLALAPFICFQTFGRGWGTPLVMASFNDFRSNVHHLSIFAVIGSILFSLACTFVTIVFYGVLKTKTTGFRFQAMHPQTSLYVVFPSVFGNDSRFWLLLFFFMITSSEISSITLQLKGLLTSFFDEFEEYRHRKTEITFGLIGFFAFSSLFYCSNIGFSFFHNLNYFQVFSQALIFLILLIIVLWIYGPSRFQRDIHFMLKISFPRLLIILIQIVTPLLILVILFFGFLFVYHSSHIYSHYEQIFGLMLKYIPWLILPAYMIFRLANHIGSIRERFDKLTKPCDWYPVDIEERQKYEASLGDSDMSHQLTECTILADEYENE